jgi:UDP-3-O-[3-hydroxymyristoyl] glucosamine N-acyltransferase
MNNFVAPVAVLAIFDLAKTLNILVTEVDLKIDAVECVTSVNATLDNSLSYLLNTDQLLVSPAQLKGLVLISKSSSSEYLISQITCSFLVVDDAKYLFAYIYMKYKQTFQEIFLSFTRRFPDHQQDKRSYISKKAYFGTNVQIGKECIIHGGVYIFGNTQIGDRVTIKPNAVIGGEGFGYALRNANPPIKMPHLGGVLIGNDVEIGSSSSIDRGTFGNTVISNSVKIDNGVHIAHNVLIGARSLIIANSEISGSVVIGEDVWVAPMVSIREKIKVGDRSVIGLGSVVTKNVAADTVVYGVPAKEVGDNH